MDGILVELRAHRQDFDISAPLTKKIPVYRAFWDFYGAKYSKANMAQELAQELAKNKGRDFSDQDITEVLYSALMIGLGELWRQYRKELAERAARLGSQIRALELQRSLAIQNELHVTGPSQSYRIVAQIAEKKKELEALERIIGACSEKGW